MGVTFIVAVNVLAFILVLQFLAMAWHFLPLLRQQVIESATVANIQPAVNSIAVKTSGNIPVDQPQPDPVLVEKFQQHVSDFQKAFRVGDFDNALREVNEALKLSPHDPATLYWRGRILETMQQPREAAADYAQVLSLPNLPAELKSQTEEKLKKMQELSAEVSAPGTSQYRSAVRDSVGLQPGASLGVISMKLRDGTTPGTKVLRLAIKARPQVKIDRGKVHLNILFYEKDEFGDIQTTESKVNTEWISPPVDWADNEPEILDVHYTLPDSNLPESSASLGFSGRKLAGYVVEVYYNNELQDVQAEPGILAQKFPSPLFLKDTPE